MTNRSQPDSNSPPPWPRPRSALMRYGVALVCLLIAFGIRYSLTPWIIDYDPFMFFAPAALVSAWFGGVGPSDYFFTGPPYEFGPYGPVQITTRLRMPNVQCPMTNE